MSDNGFNLAATKGVTEREDEGQVVELRDEMGDPMTYGSEGKPVTMLVAGTYSSAYRKAQQKQYRARARGRRGGADIDLDADVIALSAACVLAWDGLFDGTTPLPLGRENVIAVLTRAPWMHEQVLGAMNDHAGFSRSVPAAS